MKRNIARLLIAALLLGVLSAGNFPVQPPTVKAAGTARADEVGTEGETGQEGYGLHNPSRDEKDVTTWDCVYFGSYWQEDTNGDGKADKNDAKQPIRWRVLSVDGDDAFLLADKNLDAQRYHDKYEDVTWEECTMRSWLNGYGAEANKSGKDYSGKGFISDAFTMVEQSTILSTEVVNDTDSQYETETGKAASDKVYLLSLNEAENEDYGFSSYYYYDRKRKATNTAYTAAGGELRSDGMNSVGGADQWWLRSPGRGARYASGVDHYGSTDASGYDVDSSDKAVRPVLHLDLSTSSVWSYAGTVDSEGKENIVPTPAPTATAKPGGDYGLHNPQKDEKGVTTWDCIYFGSYWREDTNGDGKADQNDVKQPVRWRVLSIEGDDVFLLADEGVDVQQYSQYIKYSSGEAWEECTARSWLNGYGAKANKSGEDYRGTGFINHAFSAEEQLAIQTTKIVNEKNPQYGTKGGNDTLDKVYLLSVDEVINPAYGFVSERSSTKTREIKTTKYAKKQNGTVSAGSGENAAWWLRSPGSTTSEASLVKEDGSVDLYGGEILYQRAMRPALHLNLGMLPESGWVYAGVTTSEGKAPLNLKQELHNPVTDEEGVTTWDCVYFGNYWQEDTNGDGTADQNDEKQPVKWRVLSVEGDDAFLLADQNLDAHEYHSSDTGVAWKTCTIRSWLNGYGEKANSGGKDYSGGGFLNDAFSPTEQSAIRMTDVMDEKNNGSIQTSNNSLDKVYLLSYTEAANPAYGFASARDCSTKTREAGNTGYAKAQGALTSASVERAGNGIWWLRAFSNPYYSYVYGSGRMYTLSPNGKKEYVNPVDEDIAVRPVLHLNLMPDLNWSYAGTVTSERKETGTATPSPETTPGPGGEPEGKYGLHNPVRAEDGGTTWDCVYFGNYWQEDTNGDGKADQNDEKQPVRWRVLSVDGDDAFLLADKNLNCRDYDGAKRTTWETSGMRSWLNGYGTEANWNQQDYSGKGFIDDAFSPDEQSAIQITDIVNDGNAEYDTGGGNNTLDRVFLLSASEVADPSYGFFLDRQRAAKNTGYAKEQGAWAESVAADDSGNGEWWIRTSGCHAYIAGRVSGDGGVTDGRLPGNLTACAVRPALHLNLKKSSSNWSYAGTASDVEKETAPPTESPSANPTESPVTTPEVSPTKSPKPTPAVSPTRSPKPTPAVSPAKSPKPTPEVSPTRSPKPTPAASPAKSPKPTPEVSPTESPDATPTVFPTESPDTTPTGSPKPTPDATPTVTPAGSPVLIPTTPPAGTPNGIPFSPGAVLPQTTQILPPSEVPYFAIVGKVSSVKLKKKKQTVTVSWKKVPGADGYQVCYSTSKKWKKKRQKLAVTAKVKIRKLKKKKTYYFRVRAYRNDGTKKVYGMWSKTKKVKIGK